MSDSSEELRQRAIDAASAQAVVPPANDPFYSSTGKTKTVIIDGKSYTGIDVGSTKPPAAGGVGSISPATGQVITGADRSKAKEAEATAIGYTKEYIASRGGINSQGYFNDTPISGQLTAEEQQQVRLSNGNTNTALMLEILQKKQIAELVSQGMSETEAAQKVSSSGPSTNNLAGTITSTGNISTADTNGLNAMPTQTAASAEAESKRQNAFSSLSNLFSQYGLKSLVPKIQELIVGGAGEATITLALQGSDEYKTRFKANEIRVSKGLAALNPAEYISLEGTYRQVLNAYGLKQFNTNDYVSQFIANDVSPTELNNRVVTAVQRVQNADPAIQATLKDYYGIGNTDLVAYVLDPENQMVNIQKQVTASEIGAAARIQGLQSSAGVSEALATQGVTQLEAQKGYATIADILPTAQKLSDIYGNQTARYDQSVAEQETFNNLASAQRKRQKLTSLEIGSFSGQSGTSKGAFSTGYLNKQSSAGQF